MSLNLAIIIRHIDHTDEVRRIMARYYGAAIEAEVNSRIERMRAQEASSGFFGNDEDFWNRQRMNVARNVIREWHGRAIRAASALNVRESDLRVHLDGAMFYRYSA